MDLGCQLEPCNFLCVSLSFWEVHHGFSKPTKKKTTKKKKKTKTKDMVLIKLLKFFSMFKEI